MTKIINNQRSLIVYLLKEKIFQNNSVNLTKSNAEKLVVVEKVWIDDTSDAISLGKKNKSHNIRFRLENDVDPLKWNDYLFSQCDEVCGCKQITKLGPSLMECDQCHQIFWVHSFIHEPCFDQYASELSPIQFSSAVNLFQLQAKKIHFSC